MLNFSAYTKYFYKWWPVNCISFTCTWLHSRSFHWHLVLQILRQKFLAIFKCVFIFLWHLFMVEGHIRVMLGVSETICVIAVGVQVLWLRQWPLFPFWLHCFSHTQFSFTQNTKTCQFQLHYSWTIICVFSSCSLTSCSLIMYCAQNAANSGWMV
jgi:hypothetical protein